MAKKELEEVAQEKEVKAESPVEKQWKEYVANYIAKNPVKGAEKKARGEFDKVPDSFRGYKAK